MTILVDPALVVQTVRREAVEHLTGNGGELVLDFTSVAKIDVGAARAMEELANAAVQSSVRVGLRGVNVTVYRALKLLHLADRFSFL